MIFDHSGSWNIAITLIHPAIALSSAPQKERPRLCNPVQNRSVGDANFFARIREGHVVNT